MCSSRNVVLILLVAAVLGSIHQPLACAQQVPESALDFSLPAFYYTHRGPTAVAVADMNGDGKPDLIVSNQCQNPLPSACNSGTVAVELGNGDGTFQAPAQYYSTGNEAMFVAVGDVNGDGKPDVVVVTGCDGADACPPTSLPPGTVGVLIGNGDGTLQPVVNYSSGGNDAFGVALADVNGDGKLDVLVANQCSASSSCAFSTISGNGSVGVLLGNGDGTFQPVVSYDASGSGTQSVAVADLNGDGHLDLVVANNCEGTNAACTGVDVFLGNGDGTFQPPVGYDSSRNVDVFVAVTDVNGDKIPDIVVEDLCAGQCEVSTGIGLLKVLLGNGDGTFQPVISYSSGGYYPSGFAASDLNGDGKPDLFVVNGCTDASCSASSYSTVDVLWGNGDGTFQQAFSYPYSPGTGGEGFGNMAAADLNGDGKLDLVSIFGPGVVLNNTTPVSLVSSANPTPVGQSVAFTATVVGNNGSIPTGTVTLYKGTLPLGTVALDNAGQATFDWAFFVPGTKSMFASYSGESQFPPNNSSILLEGVNGNPTTTVLTSIPNPATVGQVAVITTRVSSSFGLPTGAVGFFQSGRYIGTQTLTNGLASLNYVFGVAQTKTITAVYAGDANFAPSTSPVLNDYVAAGSGAATVTMLTSSQNPSTVGQSVTFTATVTSNQGLPSGMVAFKKNGAGLLGIALLSNGQASINYAFGEAGTKSITAIYSGDATFGPSVVLLDQVVQ